MTSLLFAAILSAPSVTVIELPDSSARNVTLSVSIAAPFELTEREQAAWRLIPRLVLQGTKDYTRAAINQTSLEGGQLPVAVGAPDVIRLELAAAPSQLDVAASMLESILTMPSFRPDDFESARKELITFREDLFAEIHDPSRPNFEKATVQLCETLWLQACRPERISVVVSGAFESGAGTAQFEGRFKVPAAPKRGNTKFDKVAPDLTRHVRPISSFELIGDAIRLDRPDAGARLLAVHALGAGKQSTVFRVLRESAGLSYEQRAILWPTASGWRPRIYLLRRAEEGDAAILEQMIQLISTDIETWTEDDVIRSKAMATSALEGMPVDNLFWVDASGPIETDNGGNASLRAYLAMNGAPNWDRNQLEKVMSTVTLDDLKAAAAETVKTARSRMIPGFQ